MSVTHYSGIAHARAGVSYRTFYKHMENDSLSKKKVLNCNINNLTTEEVLVKLNNFTTGSDIKISDELIKRLSITVTKLGGTINNKDNKTIIESVEKHLPDPDYKNTTIKANNSKIEQITKTIANIINDDVFTTKVIDVNLEIPIILRDINIYLFDLSYSINNELIQSKLIIKDTINKLNTLNELISSNSSDKDNLNTLIKNCNESFDIIDTNEITVNKEIKYHIDKFKQINEDLSKWNQEQKLQGDTVARLLSTIKHVITITYLNNTILTSVSTELPTIKNIYKVLRSINRNNKDEFKIITQVDSIKNYFTNRNSIVGGGMEFDFASEVASSGGDFGGGGDIEGGARIELEGMTPEQLEKKKKKDRAKEAVREYVSEMNVDINCFSENVYEASKYMGTTTYDVSKLKDYLENMKWVEGLRDPNIYLAMVGYYLDDSYRAMAGQYEERLEKTVRGLRELGKLLPGTKKYLDKAAGNICNIMKTVDHFQDLLKTLLVGVCLEDIRDVVSEMPHAMGNINLAINRLYHALNISQMRRMVKKCSGELCHYTKNYAQLLALTVGGRRADLEREYQTLTADCGKGARAFDPITGRRLEFDSDLMFDREATARPGVASEHIESGQRLMAETLQPGGFMLSQCSLIWKYKNLANRVDGPGRVALIGQKIVAMPAGPLRDRAHDAVAELDRRIGIASHPPTKEERRAINDAREALERAVPAGPLKELEWLLKTPDYLQNFEKFLKEVEGEFRAKHRIYKAMESLDLLLSVFTKEIAGDIDLMKEVKKYLEDTKVYTKWFTDYTGDLLAAIFESMPAYIHTYEPADGGDITFEGLKNMCKKPPTGALDGLTTFTFPNAWHGDSGCELGCPEYNTLSQDLKNPICISFYYKQLANTIRQTGGYAVYGKATGVPCMKGSAILRKGIDEFYNNFQALKNIFHSFITLYNRIISRGVRNKSLMTPSQIYYSILSYIKQSALARRLQPGDQYCHNLCEGSIGFRGKIENPMYPSCIPFRTTWYTSLVGMIMPAYYPSRRELHCYSIYEETGYPNGAPPAPIFRGGANGYDTVALPPVSSLPGHRPPPVRHAAAYATPDAYATPATSASSAPPPGELPDWDQADKMYRNNIANTYKSVYETEDRLCVMGVKSIASVVLSCMGLFTIQQQPVNMGLQKTVRSIIGGGKGSNSGGGLLTLTSVMGDSFRDPNVADVKVSCNLFESYYYITRLCEFYKMLFKNMTDDERACQNTAGNSCLGNQQLRPDERYDCKIRLPIDLEGDFGKILYVVANNEGVYGERDANIIITTINKLCSKYRSVDEMLCGLISDVNRRFSCALDEESQWKFESLGDRLDEIPITRCSDALSSYATSYCKRGMGCKSQTPQTTGSMPFDDESPDDADTDLLDDTITPSDALVAVAEKYIGFNAKVSGCRPGGLTIQQERNIAKLNFCGEFKLFHKLARMRSMLDELFDEYLRTQYDKCRDDNKPRALKHFPLSTDFYRESFHEDFVDQMKIRCKSAKGCNKTMFTIATDLLNSKGRGTIDDKKGGNTDTLFAFSETVALMANCLYNTRNIIKTCLEDISSFSGERIYHEFKDDAILPHDFDYDFFWVILFNASHNAWAADNIGIRRPDVMLTTDTLSQCYEFEYRAAVGGDWQENTPMLNTLYMIVIKNLMLKMGGIKLLGIGNLQGGAARIKDCIASIWACKPEMRPHNVAKNIVLGGQYKPGLVKINIPGEPTPDAGGYSYSDLPDNKKALLIKETITQVLLRFDLTAVQSNSMGTIARLSSSLDGLVSTTISTQGTFMDITPVENLVIDCLGELKIYASRFYDALPTNTMTEYYQRSAPGSGGNRTSIYDMEYDFTTYFEPHVTDKIKRLPLIAVVNNTMTMVHKSLVGDLRSVLYTEAQLRTTPDNDNLSALFGSADWRTLVEKRSSGGNSLINAIMPNHYEPHPINRLSAFPTLGGGSDISKSANRWTDMFRTFAGATGARDGGDHEPMNACLQNICSDFAGVNFNNVHYIDPLSNGEYAEALLPAFNYGIRSMLTNFYDYGTRKIYKGILDMFMTDKMSLNVEHLETSYPDLFAQGLTGGDHLHLAMPKPGSIVCTSIAIMLRLLFTSINTRTQISQHTYESLSEIKNTSLVEVMKLKLPMFREYFIKLVNKCRVIRGFLTKGCGSRENKRRLIACTEPFSRAVGGVVGEHTVYTLNMTNISNVASVSPNQPAGDTPYEIAANAEGGIGWAADNVFGKYARPDVKDTTDGDKIQLAGIAHKVNALLAATHIQPLDMKIGGKDGTLSDSTLYDINSPDEWRYGYFMELISNIEDSCISIANQCDNLLGEFTVEDQYMIPGLEYLEKHKKKYNHSTFRPLSLTSAFTSVTKPFEELHNLNTRRETNSFKLQYGAKGILFSDDMKFLNTKYIEPILCAIRTGTKSSTVRIDPSNYSKFAKNYLSLFRFNYSVLNYSQIAAVAGDYKSSDFRGGEVEIEGGASDTQVVNEVINKWDLSQFQFPGLGKYYTIVPLTSFQQEMGDMEHIDGNIIRDPKTYTIRKIKSNNPNNLHGIWLLDYLYNYIQMGDGNSRYGIKQAFGNAEAQGFLYQFNGNLIRINTPGGVDARKVTAIRQCLIDYVGLYNLINRGSLTSGKEKAIETLQAEGANTIALFEYLNLHVSERVLLNIDPRNYNDIYTAISKWNAQADAGGADPYVTKLAPNLKDIVYTVAGASNSDIGQRYDTIWRGCLGGDPPRAGAARTYNRLFRGVYRWYMNNFGHWLQISTAAIPARPADLVNLEAAGLAAGGGAALDDAQTAALREYNLPYVPLPPATIWSGNEEVPDATAPLVRLTGGALQTGSIYNLMRRSAIGNPSGLIYTTVESTTPELLLNIISGEDVEELIEVMTELISSGSGKNVGTAIQCAQQAVMLDNNEQRGSLIALLIEKNLNPINVHSMQRFIPFSNIYNYSYTFDRFVYTMYNIQMPWMDLIHAGYGRGDGHPPRNEHCTKPGQQIMCFKNIFQSTDPSWRPGYVNDDRWARGVPRDMLQLDVSSSYYADIVKETFIRMMMDPYAHIDQFVYGLPVGSNAMGANFGPVSRMMRGFDKLGMGIPKFLSDQLLSKSLLNSMYLGGQFGNNVETSVYRWNLNPIGDIGDRVRAEHALYRVEHAVSPLDARRTNVHGGIPIGPARGHETGQHLINQRYTGLAAPVSPQVGTNIATWPAHEQDRVLPGHYGTTDPFTRTTLSDSGVQPRAYAVDSIADRPEKQRLIVNQLPFYDPDTKQVLTYDLSKVFQLSVDAQLKTFRATPIDGGPSGEIQNQINMFRYEGYERFNTQLVRNVIFITNLQRMMRYSLNMWLSRAYGAVSRDHQALSAEVTERRLGDSLGTRDDNQYEDVQQSWI